MKFLNLDRVLCLSAHPDDTEYGMLGSMMKFDETTFDVLVLSNGGDFDDTTGESRQKECIGIWDRVQFNVSGRFFGKKYVKDISEDKWVNLIEQEYNVSDYDCILSLPAQDSHFEHRMVNHIAYALVRGTKCGIVTYRTPSTLEEWIPNFHVQVKEHIEEKVDILRCNFVSQKDKLYFQEDMILDFHTNYLCSKVGAGYVESFRVERVYG
jgi:LmbE family N-acetylglucosaminyl deacetylase